MNTAELYQLFLRHPVVRTDTRELQQGDLFFALKGPRFNGNAFAAKALDMGASYAVIDEAACNTNERMILVEDVLSALQQLARHHRNRFRIPFIAITGSNGKTTTKELVKAVLSTTRVTYATKGNLNNHIGIPLTLLGIGPDVEIAVIEMGANHRHEIESYCKIVNPTHGLITNIGKAHLEGFGGIEGVRKGKGELFDYLRAVGGSAFICGDFDYFKAMSRGIPEISWYGTGRDGYVHGSVIPGTGTFLSIETNYTGWVDTRLIGAYNIYNILAATAIGKYFKVKPPAIKEAIAAYVPANARSQLITRGNNSFILDAYNANPSSMQAAIENFAASAAPKKVLMLGAMMELGKESRAEHQKLADLIGQYPWEKVVLVGGDFALVRHPYIYFPEALTAKKWLEEQHFEETAVLVKGSRSIAMENILS